jgi:hypothetical protein
MNLTKTLRFCAVLLALVVLMPQAQADGAVPLIKTRTETYKNVTLVSHNATHVFVQHSRGMATLKVGDLDKETLIGLGVLAPEVTVAEESTASTNGHPDLAVLHQSFKESLAGNPPAIDAQQFERLKQEIKRVLPIVGAVLLAVHLFLSFCCMLICKKTGMQPGILVWLPVFQLIPLIRASGMSGWWFLGWFVPVLNIVAQVLWCIKICKARGKGTFAILCLIFPLTHPLAFLYLAFSGGSGEVEEEHVGRIRLEPLPT